MAIEDDVRAVLAKLDEQQDHTNAQDETGNTTTVSGDEQPEIKRVIHVDKYTLPDGSALFRLPSGEGVLVPGDTPLDTENPLDANSVESTPPATDAELDEYTITHTPTVPLTNQEETPQDAQPEPAGTGIKRRVKLSVILVPLVLISILAAGTVSYFFLLPLTATATVTITPKAKSLHTDATFTIVANPKSGEVQGRPLQASSFTKSVIVPATGHAHDDATRATGEMVFYNTDITPVSIPAGITFTVNGIAIVTDNAVTIPAALPPIDSQAVTYAHAVQTGSQGNIPAGAVYTHCCSASVIATNVTPFTGGQDAKDYSFIQTSDIQNAATDLLASLTPRQPQH